MVSQVKNKTFGPLLDFPPDGFRSLPLNAVYRNKFSGEGKVAPEELPPDSWKVRLVILGFLMKSGRDFDDTFAPTAAPTSIRILAVLATRLRMLVKVADVETAFLVPKMDKVVYVKALLWYEQIVADISGAAAPTELPVNACRQLLKGVPGIKQGSRLFYLEVKKILLSLGFLVHPADPCVYYRLADSSKPFVALAVWVDDIFSRPFRMPEFRGLIALANYISVWTRPDITFVVNKLCKYMANAGDKHIDDQYQFKFLPE